MNTGYDVGVDLSLSSPAICVAPSNIELDINNCSFVNIQSTKKYVGYYEGKGDLNIRIDFLPKVKSFQSRQHRLEYMLNWFSNMLPIKINNFYIEGYSMASVGNISTICEFGGLVRNVVHVDYNVPIIEFPPTKVKKVFSGAGDAKKDEIIDTFVQRTGVVFSDIIGNDIDYYHSLITDLTDSFAVLYTGRNQHLIEETTKKKGKK